MKQIVLDTETTGLDVRDGHRVIEFACIELDSRRRTGRTLHYYVNPERQIDRRAQEIHGIDNEFLADKPLFADVAAELYEFIKGAELIIHNAVFDLGFLDFEFRNSSSEFDPIKSVCSVFDTLEIAQEKRPGRRNSLDALANEFGIDVSGRTLHGAMLDAEILFNVYLALTSGQTVLEFGSFTDIEGMSKQTRDQKRRSEPFNVVMVQVDASELELHEKILDDIDQVSEKGSIWRRCLTKSSKKLPS